jgi:DNA-directed RNA polymerase subunit N
VFELINSSIVFRLIVYNIINRMIIPVCCTTCGKTIGNLWNKYNEVKKRHSSSTQEKLSEELLKEFKLKRYCCKKTLLTHVEIIDELVKYK